MKSSLIALASLALLAPQLHAVIYYSGDQNLQVAYDDLEGIYLNFETGALETLFPDDFDTGAWLNITQSGYGIFNGEGVRPIAATGGAAYDPDATTDYYLNIAPGTLVDGSSAFVVNGFGSQYHMTTTGEADKFTVGETGYLAFAWMDSVEETTHYGWLRLIPGVETGTIVDWAYEMTPDMGIVVGDIGAIPEPATTGMAAAALSMGLVVSRRRRA